MNKQRRKELNLLIEAPLEAHPGDIARIRTLIEELQSSLEALRDEEEGFYDNMPESLQSGKNGDLAQQAIDAMDEGISALDEALQNLEAAAECIGRAAE